MTPINYTKTERNIAIAIILFLIVLVLLRIPITITETVEGKHYHLNNPEEYTSLTVTIERTYRFRPFSDSGLYVVVQFDGKQYGGNQGFLEKKYPLNRVVRNNIEPWGAIWRVSGFDQTIITIPTPTDHGTRSWNSSDGEVIVCGDLSHEEVIKFFAP